MRTLLRSLIAIVALTAVFGLAYPAVMVGLASVSFSSQSQGSLLYRNGTAVGSALVAQDFTSPAYFHGRPSATTPAYNAGATTFLNLGPTNPALAKAIHEQATAILKLEGPYNPGLTIHQIPVDAVVPSGSGIDPEISLAYARLQARRVAAVRQLPLAMVDNLIQDHTTGRSLGVLGEPGVNVVELNLALDALGGK